MSILSVNELSFSYGEIPVFTNVSFELQKGELLAVLGPNGCGKSTLFRCILGLERRYRGDVLLEGENICGKKPAEMAQYLAYVPQKIHPVFNYSVTDMVLMGATAGKRLPGKKHSTNAAQALEQAGISELARRDFRQLSGGEQQMVLIARALAQDARILALDEPESNLDYGNQHRLMGKIKWLTKNNRTVLLSTHNPNHVFRFADRVLAICNQKIAALGTPAAVLTEELIGDLYGLEVKLKKDANGAVSCFPV